MKLGIGVDALPRYIRWSKMLTGNHLGMLANVEAMPAPDENFTDERLQALHQYFQEGRKIERIENYAVELLDKGQVAAAWQVLLSLQTITHDDYDYASV